MISLRTATRMLIFFTGGVWHSLSDAMVTHMRKTAQPTLCIQFGRLTLRASCPLPPPPPGWQPIQNWLWLWLTGHTKYHGAIFKSRPSMSCSARRKKIMNGRWWEGRGGGGGMVGYSEQAPTARFVKIKRGRDNQCFGFFFRQTAYFIFRILWLPKNKPGADFTESDCMCNLKRTIGQKVLTYETNHYSDCWCMHVSREKAEGMKDTLSDSNCHEEIAQQKAYCI